MQNYPKNGIYTKNALIFMIFWIWSSPNELNRYDNI